MMVARSGLFVLIAALWASSLGLAVAQTPRLRAEQFKNLGVAYLEEERTVEALRAFTQVTQLAGDEPLGYANLGVARMRLGQLDLAASLLEQARRLDPRNVDVLLLATEVQYAAAQWRTVITMARRVLDVDPRQMMARYYMYRAAVNQGDDQGARQLAAEQLEQLFQQQPRNLVVALKYARLQAERRNWEKVETALVRVESTARDVTKAAELLRDARQALAHTEQDKVRYCLVGLDNVLLPTARYRQDLFQLQPPVRGLPLLRFSDAFYAALEREQVPPISVQFVPVSDPSIPTGVEHTVALTHASLAFVDLTGDGRQEWLIGTSSADGAGTLQLWQRSRDSCRNTLAELGRTTAVNQARFVDLDNDDCFEVVAVGPTGTLVLARGQGGRWSDTRAAWGLPSLPAVALEQIDADNEGDLDLCLAGTERFTLWQNRPNSTLADVSQSSGLLAVGGDARQIIATDHDDDLDTDLLIADADDRLHLWDNRRHGEFAEKSCGLSEKACRSAVVRDIDNDGFEDLILVLQSGQVVAQLNQCGSYAPSVDVPLPGLHAMAVADLDYDNDGWADLAVAGQQEDKPDVAVLRNRGDGSWTIVELPVPIEPVVTLGVVDYDRDGDQDLVAVQQRGRVHTWRNDGGNAHQWLNVQLRGLRVAGLKNNLHGLGSKLEIKAGLFYQMQYVRGPQTHFGLGRRDVADLLRVVWSNGVPQNRFRPVANQTIREPQVLKGSCPYLYCWDGSQFVFVTDTLAGAPLGLQVAEGVLAPDNPRELLTIDREKIASKDGRFVFQYTSELWETVYLDEVALWTVDHPKGTDVFTDQRFLPPPYNEPRPVLTRQRIFPVRAENTRGQDVRERVLRFDHQYPERFVPTGYQGVVEPHCLTLHFGDVSGLQRPVLAIRCWIFWTDTSINVAMSQDPASSAPATALEVWDPRAGWREVDEPFGLPCGKDKWILLDVAGQIDPHDARVRIRSTSQIYWDQVFLVDQGAVVPHRKTMLAPVQADLHYGGFNELYRPAADGPHLYRYHRATHEPIWMDMTGLVTRYGDVTELLTASDDRLVIFTGGDELTLRFDASELPELPAGWQRDFLFYSDGWEKDSDRNTIHGQTVEPLPFHGMSAYPYPAGESYPDDRLHRDYLQQYNTRPIGPGAFRRFVKDYHDDTPTALPWDKEPGVRGDHSK